MTIMLDVRISGHQNKQELADLIQTLENFDQANANIQIVVKVS